jgi:hypothetical protein
MDAAFALMATHVAQIYSPPVTAGGKRGAPVPNIGDTACVPLDYVSAQIAQRLGLDAPARLRQTFLDGRLNIPRGSMLVWDDGRQYPIKATEPWDWGDGGEYTHLVVEAPEA